MCPASAPAVLAENCAAPVVRGNLRIAYVGEMILALYVEVANLRAEGFAHLAHVPGKLDRRPAFGHLDVLESLRVEPVGHGLYIGVHGPKSFAKIVRSQP